MKRLAIIVFGLVAGAGGAVLAADSAGKGIRHRDLVREARDSSGRTAEERPARGFAAPATGRHEGRRDDRREHRWGREERGWQEARMDDRRWQERPSWRDARGRPWRHEPRWYHDYRLRYYRYDGGRYHARERYHIGIYVLPRGYGHRLWRVGDWLPYGYYDGGRYVLRDYWRYRLYDPPYWAHWIRVRDDAVLVDLGTGEVIDVVYGLFW